MSCAPCSRFESKSNAAPLHRPVSWFRRVVLSRSCLPRLIPGSSSPNSSTNRLRPSCRQERGLDYEVSRRWDAFFDAAPDRMGRILGAWTVRWAGLPHFPLNAPLMLPDRQREKGAKNREKKAGMTYIPLAPWTSHSPTGFESRLGKMAGRGSGEEVLCRSAPL